MSAYARPTTRDEALALLARPGAAVLAGGTDLAGQVDRGIRAPELLVDLRDLGLDAIAVTPDGGVELGATVTLATLARADALAPYAAVREAASVAASPLLRAVGTVGGNLLQHTRCWYYRSPEVTCWLGGGSTCYAQLGDHRKHGLAAGDCISAHPSDLAPALAACGAQVVLRAGEGSQRVVPLLDLYRLPSEERRSLHGLEPGEILTAVRLPAPPTASAYRRAGERAAFSFPLVSVAAARTAEGTSLVTGGVANVPVALDLADPLAGLPGTDQTAWKRDLLSALVERTLAALDD